MNTERTPVIDRLLAKVDKHSFGECWVWTGATCGAKAYGLLHVPPDGPHSSRLVHRISYELFVGEIPSGCQVDHMCENTLCVNPDHLQALPDAEHRAISVERRTTCRRGHPRTPENLLKSTRQNVCRICHSDQTRDNYRTRAADVRAALSISDKTGEAFQA